MDLSCSIFCSDLVAFDFVPERYDHLRKPTSWVLTFSLYINQSCLQVPENWDNFLSD